MDYFLSLIDFILHIDKHLDAAVSIYGSLTYGILTLIVFCETGLVVLPFLPGDSLLFAAGALAGNGMLDIFLLTGLLMAAAIIGDSVNYQVGYHFGPWVLARRLIKHSHLEKTERFFIRYGSKTIVLARFVPIVRTIAPFLAGVGKMHYGTFLRFNCIGGVVWVGGFLAAGYLFGGLEIVKRNFGLIVIAIIVISVLPLLIELVMSRKKSKQHVDGNQSGIKQSGIKQPGIKQPEAFS